MELSIVVPIYNERQNLTILYKELKRVIDPLNKTYEIIFVNDGSKDGSEQIINNIAKEDKKVRPVHFRKNFGQTAALDAGFKHSKGNIVITLDGDLQNDPRDIPKLLQKIDEGFDVVAGRRFNRKDGFSKKFISVGARFLRKTILKDRLHDSGCTLRAYKKECLENFNLYGEMHRFVHVLLKGKGFKIAEIKVNHRKRVFGKTKYNFQRTIKSLLDMVLLKFWMNYANRPMHMFGSIGILTGSLGFIVAAYLAFIRIFLGQSISNRPLLLLAVLLMVMGAIFFMFGLLADILIKVYYKDQESYSIK